MSTNVELAEAMRGRVAKSGDQWHAEVRDWWLAMADALVDGELHAGGVCGARPCLLHDKLAAKEDAARYVYERAEAVYVYRQWKGRGR